MSRKVEKENVSFESLENVAARSQGPETVETEDRESEGPGHRRTAGEDSSFQFSLSTSAASAGIRARRVLLSSKKNVPAVKKSRVSGCCNKSRASRLSASRREAMAAAEGK